VPQLLVWLKLLALVPVNVIPEIVSAPVPVLVTVTLCAVAVAPANMLGKVSDVAFRLATGVGVVTVPLSGTVADPPELALFAIVSVAE
jgi:hypothetical protein